MALFREGNGLAAGAFARGLNRLFGQKIPEKLQGIEAQSPGNGGEFNKVDPPFAALVFRDKGLRLPELLCQSLLRHASLMSHCDKQLYQARILRGFEGLLH